MAITLQRWPIIGRRSELEVFEKTLCSGEYAGLVIHGRAGVGKTRLADECLQWAAAGGHPTERVVGNRTTALLPLGAVVALLAGGLGRPGPDGQVNTVALFEQTRRALHERHHGRRLVTIADDVSLLDAASVALLGYLAAQGTIFLIATVRTGEPVPDLLTGLWRDGRVERVDLQDLSRTQLDTLLHLALGGPIEAGAGRECWEVSEQLDAVGALLLGEALYELGVFDASERVLALGQGQPCGEQVALRLAVTRAKNAQWGLCQPEAALAINADARAVVTSPQLAEELVADEASILTFSGRPDRALAVLERIAGRDRRTRVVRAIAGAPALAMTGRTAEAVGVAEAGYADHVALGDELAIAHPAMHIVNQVFALTEAGRLAEAERLARAGAEIVASYRVPIAQIFFAANLGRVATLQGRVGTARRYYAEAAGLAEASRFAGPRRLVLSGLALAHAMLGDADAAARALAERASGPVFGFRGPEQQLADAWTAIACRRRPGSRRQGAGRRRRRLRGSGGHLACGRGRIGRGLGLQPGR